MFKGVNVCVYVGEVLRRSLATPDPFVLTNKICLNQLSLYTHYVSVLNADTKSKFFANMGEIGSSDLAYDLGHDSCFRWAKGNSLMRTLWIFVLNVIGQTLPMLSNSECLRIPWNRRFTQIWFKMHSYFMHFKEQSISLNKLVYFSKGNNYIFLSAVSFIFANSDVQRARKSANLSVLTHILDVIGHCRWMGDVSYVNKFC